MTDTRIYIAAETIRAGDLLCVRYWGNPTGVRVWKYRAERKGRLQSIIGYATHDARRGEGVVVIWQYADEVEPIDSVEWELARRFGGPVGTVDDKGHLIITASPTYVGPSELTIVVKGLDGEKDIP